jgi:GDP-4-dehydro-6-deoxy-D-mannose reductase
VSDAVLVTGASGFAGGHLLELLDAPGAVTAWSRSPLRPELAAKARWQRVDLLDRDAVRAAVAALRPATVYHCAGAAQVARSWVRRAEPLAANVLATHHLLDALRRTGRPCRLLVTGSAAIYAPSAAPLTEDSPLAPDSPYAVSKLAQEALGARAVVEDGVGVILTRAFNHTGPRQDAAFAAPGIARQIALIERGAIEPVLRAGNVEAQRELTDVRDVVRAYAALMTAGAPGEIYNVASGVGRSIRSVIETLAALARVRVRIETDPDRLRPSDKPVLVGDSHKLRALTGWAPQIPFEQTMRDLLDYWRTAA